MSAGELKGTGARKLHFPIKSTLQFCFPRGDIWLLLEVAGSTSMRPDAHPHLVLGRGEIAEPTLLVVEPSLCAPSHELRVAALESAISKRGSRLLRIGSRSKGGRRPEQEAQRSRHQPHCGHGTGHDSAVGDFGGPCAGFMSSFM